MVLSFSRALFSGFFVFLTLVSLTAHATPTTPANPGGMWMPQQMPENAAHLRALGLQIDPQELADPQSGIMQAIVSLDGCSGSFISPEGLVITNHHCVDAMLSYFSQQDQAAGKNTDFVRSGFRSDDRSQERNVGPARRIFVTEKFEDVSAQVLANLAALPDGAARTEEISKRVKALIAESERSKPGIKTEVKSFFQGEKYFLIERLEIKDVRMVYAPPKSVGAFAEDPDNFRYPRHTGDFAMLRAYVAPDGTPAPYSAENVPYQPKNHLKISARGVSPGGLVLVAGFPGSTSRLTTAPQVEHQVARYYPLLIDIGKSIIELLDRIGKDDDVRRKKSESLRKGQMNRLQKFEGALESLASIGFLEEKEKFDADLRAWIQQDPSRVHRFGTVLDDMQRLQESTFRVFETDEYLLSFISYSKSLLAAVQIVRTAQERAKANDVDRSLGYQQRDWERLRQGIEAAHLSQDRETDIQMMHMLAQRALRLPEPRRPAFLAGAGVDSLAGIQSAFSSTQIDDLAYKLNLFDTATPESLTQSPDTFIQLALKMTDYLKVAQRVSATANGDMALLVPRYMEALREFLGRPVAPDANSTLRVTYGQVKGFTEPTTGQFIHPFTNVSQMIKKAIANDFNNDANMHYDVPQEIIQAARERRYGPYADPYFGEMPLNFVADVDTTGGNSGSAALNAKGELVGLLFDGTMHSLYGDWTFSANTRSVLLDIRYALWLLDKVYNVQHVLKELQVDAPSVCEYALGRDDISAPKP